jgi:hypothetical protein
MSSPERVSLETLIGRLGATMTVERLAERPDQDADEWSRDASHWQVTVKRARRTFRTYYSMGSAHTVEPDITSVIDALVSDAGCAESNRDIDEFAREMGYDEDAPVGYQARRERPSLMERARRVQRAWRACKRARTELIRLFGEDGYASLRDSERL